jgi:hypothetical protein
MRATTTKRVAKHRAKLRTAGLRPIQIWVPDTRRPGFAREARRQSLLAGKSRKNKKLIEAWEKTADRTGWK